MARQIWLGITSPRAEKQGRGEQLHLPLIETRRLPLGGALLEAIERWELYTHLIATSKQAVIYLAQLLREAKIPFGKKKALAVGAATARCLEQHFSIEEIAIAEPETAEGLCSLVDRLPLEGAHLFWPHASGARPVIVNYFSEAKASLQFDQALLYESWPRVGVRLPLLAEGDQLVFTSPSCVEAFLQLFGGWPICQVELVAIGPVTAASLQARGGCNISFL